MDFVILLRKSIKALDAKDPNYTYKYEITADRMVCLKTMNSRIPLPRAHRVFKDMDKLVKFAWGEVNKAADRDAKVADVHPGENG
jgi:hypothetical protein